MASSRSRTKQTKPTNPADIQRIVLMKLRHNHSMMTPKAIKAELSFPCTIQFVRDCLTGLRKADLVDAYPAIDAYKINDNGLRAIEGF